MRHDCEICRGSGVIRLPIYRRAQAVVNFSAVATMDESSRSYPCPECADGIPQGRLAIVQYHSLVDSRMDDAECIRHAKDVAAHSLVAGLLNGGFIRFERGPYDAREMQFPMRVTVGVVSPTQVATLEHRVAEHQEQLACEVMAEAARQIRHWGSHYNGHRGNLSKDSAVDSVNAALAIVLAKRNWKAA